MKNIFTIVALLICVFCFTTTFSIAQYSKYIVVFKNKTNSSYQLNKPGKYLSQKAIDRRTRYSISIDSSDLPVNPSYISKVLLQGTITYLSQSKWLNQILVYTADKAGVQAVRDLPFVKKVTGVAPESTTSKPVADNKFKEQVTKIDGIVFNPAALQKLNYGNSYDQIHIHNGEFLHNHGFTGNGITISVIDAGFYNYKTIKAFDSARAHKQFLGEKDFVDFDNSVNEDYNHGELCLSIIAANVPGTMIGSAPDADFWLLRSENAYSEYPVEEHNWAVAAEFADSAGTDMISSSLGYNLFDDSQFNHTYNDFYRNSTMVSKAATYAVRKGIIVTNSAGNEGNNSWKYLIFPADADSVCSVAATDVSGNIASFSSYGYPGKIKPNVASVGSGTTIYSSTGVSVGSGTSFSNPNINGLIACLWQAFPHFNNMEILDAVYKSGDRYKTPDNRYGYGIPNMHNAYYTLKTKQNTILYGNEWLFVLTTNFNEKISLKLIARLNGKATLNLLNSDNKIVATKNIITEQDEVYDYSLDDLSNLPAGNYTLQYNDGTNTKNTSLSKQAIASKKILSKPPVITEIAVQ